MQSLESGAWVLARREGRSRPTPSRAGRTTGLLAAVQVEHACLRCVFGVQPSRCHPDPGSWRLPPALPPARCCLGLQHLGAKELSGGNVSLPGSHATSWPWGRWARGPDLLPSYSQAACSPASPAGLPEQEEDCRDRSVPQHRRVLSPTPKGEGHSLSALQPRSLLTLVGGWGGGEQDACVKANAPGVAEPQSGPAKGRDSGFSPCCTGSAPAPESVLLCA